MARVNSFKLFPFDCKLANCNKDPNYECHTLPYPVVTKANSNQCLFGCLTATISSAVRDVL